MRKASVVLLVAAMFLFGQATDKAFDGPEQAARGQRLFIADAKPVACAVCHSIGGTVRTAGPDLKIWAGVAPRGTASAITTALTEKSVSVELKDKGSFPGRKVYEDSDTIQFFDLAKKPPELRTVPKADILEMKINARWKHPPGTEKYSAVELADLIAYIRWVGNRDKTPVDPGTLQ